MATVEESYDGEVRRKVTRKSYKIEETMSTTKTTTSTTPSLLYGKDINQYDEIDVDSLLSQLTPEEMNILAKEVDPDDNLLPPSQRCSYECEKDPTGPLDRKKLIEHINKQALETPDQPELKPFVPGVIRGKKWVAPKHVPGSNDGLDDDEEIGIDLGEEYDQILTKASQEEIIDLAAILGFHSMMNQDQYHASLLNKGQPIGMGWDGITKASQPKFYPMDPPNTTDVDKTIQQVKDDDYNLTNLNWNNIKNVSDEKLETLFAALPESTHLEILNLTNVGLRDHMAEKLADALEHNNTLRVINIETNFLTARAIVRLLKSLLKTNSVEEFRASNQRNQVLGNKIEMEITELVEANPTLLRLGLHLEYNDARSRIANHLQRNIDRKAAEISAEKSALLAAKAAAEAVGKTAEPPVPAVVELAKRFTISKEELETSTTRTEPPLPFNSAARARGGRPAVVPLPPDMHRTSTFNNNRLRRTGRLSRTYIVGWVKK